MKLDSALALKQEIRTAILSRDTSLRGELLIGVAPGINKRDCKLAIRVADADQLNGTTVQQLIKKSGRELDVREVGQIAVEAQLTTLPWSRDILRAGSSISHYAVSVGSLGFFATRIRDGRVGFVSCSHVLANYDYSQEGDVILSPAAADRGVQPRDVVGYLDADFPRLTSAEVIADCAFALLAEGVPYEPWSLKLKSLSDETELWGMLVHKVGRTTKRTSGKLSAFGLDGVSVRYPFGPVLLSGQIEIESTDSHPFVGPGDSGALVFTDDNRAVGLACASSARGGGAANLGLTYVSPATTVLEALGVEFLS